MDTPVIVLAFNRPDLTARLIECLSSVRPARVLVVCDGPREGSAGEAARVSAVRDLFENLPWSCEVVCNYSDTNLGCARRVSSGLTWAFEQVEEAIILEDDCLPAVSFFPYAAEMLDRYRHDPRVGSISGTSPGYLPPPGSPSYRFSRYCFIWGWATWRRAWTHYDFGMAPVSNGELRGILKQTFPNWRARWYWQWLLRRVHRGRINTWDYQWFLTCWREQLSSVVPSVNLVENVGFGKDSTHTQFDPYELGPPGELSFPLRHPERVELDLNADTLVENAIFSRTLPARARWTARILHARFSAREAP